MNCNKPVNAYTKEQILSNLLEIREIFVKNENIEGLNKVDEVIALEKSED